MSEPHDTLDPTAAPPSASRSPDLHHRAWTTQSDDGPLSPGARAAGGTGESRADPRSGGGGSSWSPYRRDLLVQGAAFLCLFVAYSAVQNLETSLHPRGGIGAVSLAVIYGGIVVFAPLAPAVIRYLRPRGAMLLGMSGYCAYIAANASPSSWVLLLSAAYLGASASVLWVAQGVYSVLIARGHAAATGMAEQAAIAEFSGIFWGVFAANQVVGNAITFLVCQLMALLYPAAAAAAPEGLAPATVTVLIVTFLLFLALAAALTCLLRDISDSPSPTAPASLEGGRRCEEDGEEQGEGEGEGESKALLGGEGSLGRSEEREAVGGEEELEVVGEGGAGAGSKARGGRSAWELMKDTRLQLLLPLLFYIGLQSAFVAADFTLYVVRPALGVPWIGGAMSVFGVANSVACMLAARFSSGLASIHTTILIGAACQGAVLLSLLLQTIAVPWLVFPLVLLQAVLWGVGDAAFQSQINALLPLVFPRDMDASFAHMKMWTSAASSLMFLLSPYLTLTAKAIFLAVSCAASLPLMFAVVHAS